MESGELNPSWDGYLILHKNEEDLKNYSKEGVIYFQYYKSSKNKNILYACILLPYRIKDNLKIKNNKFNFFRIESSVELLKNMRFYVKGMELSKDSVTLEEMINLDVNNIKLEYLDLSKNEDLVNPNIIMPFFETFGVKIPINIDKATISIEVKEEGKIIYNNEEQKMTYTYNIEADTKYLVIEDVIQFDLNNDLVNINLDGETKISKFLFLQNFINNYNTLLNIEIQMKSNIICLNPKSSIYSTEYKTISEMVNTVIARLENLGIKLNNEMSILDFEYLHAKIDVIDKMTNEMLRKEKFSITRLNLFNKTYLLTKTGSDKIVDIMNHSVNFAIKFENKKTNMHKTTCS